MTKVATHPGSLPLPPEPPDIRPQQQSPARGRPAVYRPCVSNYHPLFIAFGFLSFSGTQSQVETVLFTSSLVQTPPFFLTDPMTHFYFWDARPLLLFFKHICMYACHPMPACLFENLTFPPPLLTVLYSKLQIVHSGDDHRCTSDHRDLDALHPGCIKSERDQICRPNYCPRHVAVRAVLESFLLLLQRWSRLALNYYNFRKQRVLCRSTPVWQRNSSEWYKLTQTQHDRPVLRAFIIIIVNNVHLNR
jgi:hypothetical protein